MDQNVQDIEQLGINTARLLSVDGVQKANSGHPGMPMGAAPMAHVLWADAMKYNPKNPALKKSYSSQNYMIEVIRKAVTL